ncbi:DUF6768 family protein [Yunchengibacter salinarum]|uniref:DUF6768 family protein n=1 Tax=Yunchengibacter salinarum TaxID=3133399 RepID=UPI0035B5EBED
MTLNTSASDPAATEAGEPGYIAQVGALFRGPLGWIMKVAFVAQILFFAGAVYCAVAMLHSHQITATIQWGVATIVLVQFMVFLRGFMVSHFETNRILRRLDRAE